jgi:hypothetical protein
MSTWTNITDTVLEPGQPIRSVDIIAIKNNILAVPGGAANAPRVQTAAIQDDAVTSAKLATGERMTTGNVLAATAGASVGAVGTYAWLGETTTTLTNAGGTRAGSGLRYAGISGAFSATSDVQFAQSTGNGGTPAGTWRCMGRSYNLQINGNDGFGYTLWLRIS